MQAGEPEECRMLWNLECPSCGDSQRASDAVFGKTVLCPTCGGCFQVASPNSSTAPSSSWKEDPSSYRGDSRKRPQTHSRSSSIQEFHPPTGASRFAKHRREGLPPWIFLSLGGA